MNPDFRSGSVEFAKHCATPGDTRRTITSTQVEDQDHRIALTLAAAVVSLGLAPSLASAGSSVIVEQYGNFNSVVAAQKGKNNVAHIYQKKKRNSATVVQVGRDNIAVSGQDGYGNYSATYQFGKITCRASPSSGRTTTPRSSSPAATTPPASSKWARVIRPRPPRPATATARSSSRAIGKGTSHEPADARRIRGARVDRSKEAVMTISETLVGLAAPLALAAIAPQATTAAGGSASLSSRSKRHRRGWCPSRGGCDRKGRCRRELPAQRRRGTAAATPSPKAARFVSAGERSVLSTVLLGGDAGSKFQARLTVEWPGGSASCRASGPSSI